MIVDLFAGPGGWSEGLRSLGLSDIGLELDRDACLTRRAAGHRTIRADVSAYPPEPFAGRCSGLIASPPCQAWSMAGKGDGRREIGRVHAAVGACRAGWDASVLAGEWDDPRTALILEPLRWAWTIRPRWIACEQVPPAMPVWEHMADVLRSWGYRATAVKLLAADYGVPQTRLRAFLLASLDGPVRAPEATHAKDPVPGLFGSLLPWVSMAEALGWVPGSRAWDRRVGGNAIDLGPVGDERPAPTMTGSGKPVWVVRTGTNSMKHSRELDDMVPHERSVDEPAPTVDAKAGGAWKVVGNNSVAGVGRAERDGDEPALTVGSRADLWRLQVGSQANATSRPAPAPAPALVFAHDAAGVQWVYDRPAPTIVGTRRSEDGMLAGRQLPPGEGRNVGGKDWVHGRPATTVAGGFLMGGDQACVIPPPGNRDMGPDGPSRQDVEGAVRITLSEAAVLQSFPPDYPFQGTKTSRFSQVGNACPPVLSAAVIGALLGLAP